MYFKYGDKEMRYLKEKDKKLGEIIDKLGYVYRKVNDDIYSSIIYHIIGQQISTKAHETIWQRMIKHFNQIEPDILKKASRNELQKLGITFKKADYIIDFTEKVVSGEFDLEGLWYRPDEEVVKSLSSINGIGKWTAEMIMIFCMQRPNIISFGDLAIHRGLRMIYHHRVIDEKLFKKYQRRFHPYESVASIYIWAVAGGVIEGMKDYAFKKKV